MRVQAAPVLLPLGVNGIAGNRLWQRAACRLGEAKCELDKLAGHPVRVDADCMEQHAHAECGSKRIFHEPDIL